jgi:outer membrane protein
MKQQFRMLGQICIAGLLTAVLASTAAAAADVRLAYVDLQRALNECNAGKKAKTDFRAEIERLQSKLQQQQSEVESLKDELDKKGMLMRDDERRNLQDEYASKVRDFESTYKNDKDLLQQKDNEITGAILRDLAYVVRQVGQRNGYTMVMEKGSLLWAIPSDDITDQVIREYNETGGAVGSLGDRDAGSFSNAGSSSGGGDSDAASDYSSSTSTSSTRHHRSSISK